MTESDKPTDTKTDAKADAKADKARAKAMRPWYKKKRWIMPLAAIVLLFIAIGSSGSEEGDPDLAADEDSDEETADSGSTDDSDEEPQHAAIGEPAVDGQFTFTVTDQLDCGHGTVGEEPMAEDAQGQWCILTAEVENTGDEARSLTAAAQLLYDTENREFEASSPMGVDSPFLEQINPGNSVEGDFFFDVPEDFAVSHAQLHDSLLSGGIQVDLAG